MDSRTKSSSYHQCVDNDGFVITYPEYGQCGNITPYGDNGGFVLNYPTAGIYCFYSEPNCTGERVCLTPYSTSMEYYTLIPATENMLKYGIQSTVVMPMKPAAGYEASFTVNPGAPYDYGMAAKINRRD
ncbi:hypothetical protein K7432_018476 [Basidiobolus ranarum]|uniref:Uncharacterized protein n=1 Tax=Basidiobolus ranarum TaxID=34480 RepID=A0ABR2VJ63_9FUNG